MGNENGTWIMRGLPASDPGCLHTSDELIAYINEVGFLPLFAGGIRGFSVEEHTEVGYWWGGDPKHDPWEWRAILARSGKVAYGKFFDNKAGFISLDWLPYFVNSRRDGYDFDSLWDDEKATYRQKRIMDCFLSDDELFSNELKIKAGYGKGGEPNFEGMVTGLQMSLYLCVRDFRQRLNKQGLPYGWAIAVYCTPEHLWGYDRVTAAYREEPAVSRARIHERMRELYPDVTEQQLKNL